MGQPAIGHVRDPGEFDPERGSAIFNALRAETRRLAAQLDTSPSDALQAQALHDLATSDRAGRGASRRSRPRAHLIVVADAPLVFGEDRGRCELFDGTPIVPSTLARLLCDATVTGFTRDGTNHLELGRKVRTATWLQRQALRAIYRTCAIDGSTPFDRCEIHHVEHWDPVGLTDVPNLVPVSSRLHHLLHEGGYTARIDRYRTLTIFRPDGTLYRIIPAPSTEDDQPP